MNAATLVPRTLTSRLVVTAVALVTLVSVLMGTATALAMRDHLQDQLDVKVLAASHRAGPPGHGGPDDRGDERGVPDPGLDGGGPDRFGNQEPGTLVAIPSDGDGGVWSDQPGEEQQLGGAALETLAEVPADGEVHDVDVAGFGSYRVTAVEADGALLVTGLPTDDLDAAVSSLIWWEVALALLGVLAAGAAGQALVRRQLRPLSEVAATAHTVAGLPLGSGAIGGIDRVPAHLADDRSEVGQVGAALNTLLAHVETSLAARHRSEQQVRQFVADASHELRTPLTTIAGYTELARRRPEPATTATALAKVEEESRRMTTLVEDLLLLARLDAGRPLANEPVDLTRLTLEAVDDARVVDPDRRWRVVLPEDGEPVEVAGDELRLHQALTNLLANARRHTPAGTTVTVTVRADGFAVHDDGPGFPPDLIATAFERFTRADAARHREGGAGLGLALVSAIVTAHGGSVGLTSIPGDTTVSVRLPRAGVGTVR